MSLTQAGVYTFQNSLGKVVFIGGPCVPFIFQFFTLRRSGPMTGNLLAAQKAISKVADQARPSVQIEDKTLFSVEKMDRRVVVTAEAARIGRQEMVRGFQTPLFQQGHKRDSISSRPMRYLSLSATGHTSKTSTSKASVMEGIRCIVIDDRFNKSMPNFMFILLVRCSHRGHRSSVM